MKKKVFGKKLSRSRSTRRGLLRSQARAFAEYGRIETTLAKAKFTQRFIEKLLARAVVDSVHTRRLVGSKLANDRKFTDKVFEIAKVSGKKSGFTKIVRLPARKGDASLMARLELSFELAKKEKKETGKEKKIKVVGKKEKTEKEDTKKDKLTKKVK